MRQPSEKDIEAAKAYLRQCIEVEQSMSSLLSKAMREAAERIVEICYSAGVNPQTFRYSDLPARAQLDVDAVIERLQEAIDDYFQTFAIADHEESRDEVLPLVLGENHGQTFEERLRGYCGKYRDELMLLIGAGLFLGIAKSTLVKSIAENMRHPYANQLLIDGIDADVSFGRGRTNSMLTAIDNLTQFGIAQAWMRHWEIKTASEGCVGWIVQRGSSYPCEMCDENCGFHPIDEGTNLPQHGHCACFAVPIYFK